MRGRFIEKLITFMLILFLLGYVGYQAAQYFNAPVKTETVFEHTVSQSIDAKGLVFRDELVLESFAIGTASCMFDDGERVLVGQTVVEYYNGAASGASSAKRDTQWEIDMLKEAQNPALSHFSNVDSLGRDIRQQLGVLARSASTGDYSQAGGARSSLVSLLNKRQIATGKEVSFQGRIDALSTRITELDARAGNVSATAVKAQKSGYYAKPTDGLESVLSLKTAETADLDKLLELIESAKPIARSDGSGRIITNQNWYIAVAVDKYEAQSVWEGMTLNARVDNYGTVFPVTVYRIVAENESDTAVLILRCNRVGADTVNLRRVDVELLFHQYTGLRVRISDIRFQDGMRGVFVLEKGTVRFKLLTPIYEGDGFILSEAPTDPYDAVTLRPFSQIITKGVDLYDGKVVE